MTEERLGAIPADWCNKTINASSSSVIGGLTHMTNPANQILAELKKPWFALERTFEGYRYTRRIR